ncbi:MAG: YggS family pyridoxal phosphate-dependent enzyme [Verrucomicrobia bacterium]|nr:YggS family pyridoxal phosphate-dependent enzyme [Verrucomicrobiota bacterium]
MIGLEVFKSNLEALQARMAAACRASGRADDSVSLLPVTKNHGVEAVRYAYDAGLYAVGENRVQEAASKRAKVSGMPLRWELIGHLQSNKAKEAVAVFDRIQSVDSLKLLERLNRLAGEAGKCLPILLQCNAGADPRKYGFPVDALEGALECALGGEHIKVEGLMTIAPLDDAPEAAADCFGRLRELRDHLSARHGIELKELSMGMTGDLEAAIAAGSTQIRVGTALYGQRAYPAA